MTLWDARARLIVVAIPEAVERILDCGSVVTVRQRTEVVDHANQIILARDILRRQKLKVLHMITQVVVVEREFDKGLLLAPPRANLLEAL